MHYDYRHTATAPYEEARNWNNTCHTQSAILTLVSHAAVICLVTQRFSPLTAAETWTTFLARFKPITVAVPFSELGRAKFSTRDSSNHSLRFIVDSVGCFRDKNTN